MSKTTITLPGISTQLADISSELASIRQTIQNIENGISNLSKAIPQDGPIYVADIGGNAGGSPAIFQISQINTLNAPMVTILPTPLPPPNPPGVNIIPASCYQNGPPAPLQAPVDVYVTTNPAAVYVLDVQFSQLLKFNTFADIGGGYGKAAMVWGAGGAGTGPGQFAQPMKIITDGYGNIYVADSGNNRVIQIPAGNNSNNDWNYCNGFGGDNFLFPFGLAIDGDEALYVADLGNRRIVRITNFPPQNANDWQPYSGGDDNSFNYPYGVAVGGPQNLYVVDQITPPGGTQFPDLVGPSGRIINAQMTDASGADWVIETPLKKPWALWLGFQGMYVTDEDTETVYFFDQATYPAPAGKSNGYTLLNCVDYFWAVTFSQIAGLCVSP